jgi:hypothetical protein
VSEAVVESFRCVVARFGSAEPPALPELEDERRRFESDRNQAGVNAVRAILRQSRPASGEGVR